VYQRQSLIGASDVDDRGKFDTGLLASPDDNRAEGNVAPEMNGTTSRCSCSIGIDVTERSTALLGTASGMSDMSAVCQSILSFGMLRFIMSVPRVVYV
jgi:hypothetical protein